MLCVVFCTGTPGNGSAAFPNSWSIPEVERYPLSVGRHDAPDW